MAVVAYRYFLLPNEQYANGQLNPEGYHLYAAVGGAVITVAILVSAIGTHNHIPSLKPPPPRKKFDAARVWGELRETLGNRSFLTLFFAGIFGAAAGGLTAALNLYFNTYFWGLNAEQISELTAAVYIAAILGFAATPRISAKLGKKRAALTTAGLAILCAPIGVIGRLLGIMPENGEPLLLPILMVLSIIDVTLIMMVGILVSSMVADVVEESELRTGRRSEGTFFAARSFAQKAVSGMGTWSATWILAIISFPEAAVPGEVPEQVLRDLAYVYIPSVAVLYLVFLGFLGAYRISRESHVAHVEELERRGSEN